MNQYLQYYLNSHNRFAQLLRFSTVGVTISFIDVGVVYILPWLFGTNIFFARVLSLTLANSAGYMLNRYFTFGAARNEPLFQQIVRHFSVHLVGGLINFSVFSSIVIYGSQYADSDLTLTLLPAMALWVGGLAGLSFNFCYSKRFVYHTLAN